MTILTYRLTKIYTKMDHNANYYYDPTQYIDPDLILSWHNNLEFSKYFYFDEVFDSYSYGKICDLSIGQFQQVITKKSSDINLYVKVTKLVSEKSLSVDALNMLRQIFMHIQICKITSKKNYLGNNIVKFTSNRESEYMNFDLWYHFRMDLYIFDLKANIITESEPKISFARLGGIIETNNVRKLIQTNFTDCSNDLVIGPEAYLDLWPKYVAKFTFNQMDSISSTKFNIHRLIIHECDVLVLPQIKMIMKKISPKIIWIINSLPLSYYFGQDTKLNANNILSIINLWLCFDNKQKKLYKLELLRLVFTEFNRLYMKYMYETDYDVFRINKINLLEKRNQVEIRIYEKINSYHNWMGLCSSNKISKIKFGIINTFCKLINSIVLRSDLHMIIPNIYPNENNLCPICYDTNDPVQAVLPCGHQFCLDCVFDMLSMSTECAICRTACKIDLITIVVDTIYSGFISIVKEMLIDKSTGLITDIPYINSHFGENIIDCTQITHLLIMEYNPSVRTDQFINYIYLNNKKINISQIEFI